MTNEYELSSATRQGLVYDKPDLLAPVPPGAEAPPHVDAEDGPPAIARYGPQASVSQESVDPVWALLRQQETSEAGRGPPAAPGPRRPGSRPPRAGPAPASRSPARPTATCRPTKAWPSEPGAGRHRLRAGRTARLHRARPPAPGHPPRRGAEPH